MSDAAVCVYSGYSVAITLVLILLSVCTQVILLDITLELQKQIMSELEILYKVIFFLGHFYL